MASNKDTHIPEIERVRMEKKYSSALKRWKTLLDKTIDKLPGLSSEEVQRSINDINCSFKELAEYGFEVEKHLDQEADKIAHDKHLESVECETQKVLRQCDQKLDAILDDNKSHSSYRSSHRSSRHSSHSSRSSSRSISSIKSLKLKEDTRRVELAAEAEAITKRREIEKAKIDLQFQEQHLEINTKLAIADAKSKLYQQLDTEISNQHSGLDHNATPFYPDSLVASEKHLDTEDCLMEPVNIEEQQQITAPENNSMTKPAPNNSVSDPIETLANILTKRQDRDALPKPEPEVFRGDSLKYPMWKKSFEALIERRTDNAAERLYYLGRYTAGEAKESISGILSLDTEDAYLKAKCILKQRFGDPFLVAESFRKKIHEWPKIQNDSSSLQKFADFLQQCSIASESTKYLKVLDDPEENRRILKKLPTYIVPRWGRIVDTQLRQDSDDIYDDVPRKKTISKGRYPSFKEFCNFLSKEARIASNPITGLSSLKERENPGKRDNSWKNRQTEQKRSFSTFKSEVDEDRSKTPTRKTGCLFCKGTDHYLNDCKKYLSIPMDKDMECQIADQEKDVTHVKDVILRLSIMTTSVLNQRNTHLKKNY